MITQSSKSSITAAALLILIYIATWRFWPVYALILFIPDLVIIVYYTSIFFTDVIYWIQNRKDDKPFMPFCISFAALMVIFYLPPIHSNKSYPKGAYNLFARMKDKSACDLYLQYYLAGSGFLATDVNAVYLTDLKNFRVYLGTYKEGYEKINVESDGHIIIAIKTSTEYVNSYWTDPIVLDKKGFVLSELIKNKPFE